MSWSHGDRAICIKTLPWRDELGNIVSGPVKDGIYLVDAVVVMRRKTGLSIAGFMGLWDADEFRKIIPACDRAEVVKEVA
jgi:hypothetical protein